MCCRRTCVPFACNTFVGLQLRPVTPGGLEGDGAQAKGVIAN